MLSFICLIGVRIAVILVLHRPADIESEDKTADVECAWCGFLGVTDPSEIMRLHNYPPRERPRIGLAFNEKPSEEAFAREGIGLPDTPQSKNGFDDSYAEWDDPTTVEAVEAALAEVGEVVRLEAKEDFPFRLYEARPAIVFNIAEGVSGPNRESYVPSFCEFWGIPYTGSDPLTLSTCLHKGRAKDVLMRCGIRTPAFTVISRDDELALDDMPALPALVKPVHEGSSKGITAASLCQTKSDVMAAASQILKRYRQPAIVEQWLPGKEFTCAIVGNGDKAFVLPIVEINFNVLPEGAARFYSYEAKWIWDRPDHPLDIFHCPAPISQSLAAEVEAIALAAYRALACRDWARLDVRCDEHGLPHILEVNPIPGILPDPAMNSCFTTAARAAGLDYKAMILNVLRVSGARYGITF